MGEPHAHMRESTESISASSLSPSFFASFLSPSASSLIQSLECISNLNFEVVQSMSSNPGWTTTGQPQLEQDMQKRPQELEISSPDGKKRTSFRGMKFGLFSAGSEEGFLVGERGVVPWLCRTPGSKVKLQITKVERQLPVTTIQDPFLSTLLEQERYLRFLRQHRLVVKKNVVIAHDGTWTTRSVVSKDKQDSLHRGKPRGLQ